MTGERLIGLSVLLSRKALHTTAMLRNIMHQCKVLYKGCFPGGILPCGVPRVLVSDQAKQAIFQRGGEREKETRIDQTR